MSSSTAAIHTTFGIDYTHIARAIYNAFTGGQSGGFDSFVHTLSVWWNVYSVLAITFSFLCIAGFIYAKIRTAQLEEIAENAIHEEEKAWAHAYGGAVVKNNRWNDVEAHISSEDPNDWRLGIIEADILLEETLEKAGYIGTSIGDKLKTANPASFTTLQDAWDAHKVRNEIAHAGSDYILTKRTAQEAIVKYERVFREFGAI